MSGSDMTRPRLRAAAWLLSVLFYVALVTASSSSSSSSSYNIGVGKSDVTGPVAEVVMMGYADSAQTTAGLLNRLYARAFVIHDAQTNQRVVVVNCDLHSITQLVHQQVIQRLQDQYDGLYTDQNVVLHATHTHGGPGGASAYFLYGVSVHGFVAQSFELMVRGILAAIAQAHESLAPGSVHWSKAALPDGGKQRSREAYDANPPEERAQYETDHDVDMRALQFRDLEGKLRGVLAWYAVHPTSLTRLNRFVSGDNKGYAEFLVEQQYPGVVAGIGISNAGDVSPNLVENDDDTFRGEGEDDIASAEIMGARQAATLVELLEAPAEPIHGPILGKLTYVDFSNATLEGVVATPEDPYAHRTCPAVMGQNFAAGTEDGRGLRWFKEGDLAPNHVFRTLGTIVQPTPEWVQQCHTANKVPLLAVGLAWFGPWVPTVLPLQVLRIGQFALGVTNFEVSTMAGRRIRASLRDAMAPAGVTEVEVAAMSNAYAQYVTTREEYAMQHYEGASTLFGPNQLAVVQQELVRVAKSIMDPSVPLDLGPTPPLVDRTRLIGLQPGVVLDTPGWGKRFGDLRVDANLTYLLGDTATASFYGGHPRNNADHVTSFCDVERFADGEWTTRLTDSHWDVRFEWRRVGLTESHSECRWVLRNGGVHRAMPGRYRLRHRGFAKHLLGDIVTYEGVSSAFDVRALGEPEPAPCESDQKAGCCLEGDLESCAVAM